MADGEAAAVEVDEGGSSDVVVDGSFLGDWF